MTYPKFKEDSECGHPERKDCNYGKGYDRCPYMKYNNSKSIFDSTRWECRFSKDNPSKTQDNTKKDKELKGK